MGQLQAHDCFGSASWPVGFGRPQSGLGTGDWTAGCRKQRLVTGFSGGVSSCWLQQDDQTPNWRMDHAGLPPLQDCTQELQCEGMELRRAHTYRRGTCLSFRHACQQCSMTGKTPWFLRTVTQGCLVILFRKHSLPWSHGLKNKQLAFTTSHQNVHSEGLETHWVLTSHW